MVSDTEETFILLNNETSETVRVMYSDVVSMLVSNPLVIQNLTLYYVNDDYRVGVLDMQMPAVPAKNSNVHKYLEYMQRIKLSGRTNEFQHVVCDVRVQDDRVLMKDIKFFGGVLTIPDFVTDVKSNWRLGSREISSFKGKLKIIHKNNKIKHMKGLFSGFAASEIDLTDFDFTGVVDISEMFQHDSNLIRIDLQSCDFSHVKSMQRMFLRNSSLRSVKLPSNLQRCEQTESMFEKCGSLGEISISGIDFSQLKSTELMFSGSGLMKFQTIGAKFKSLENMRGMFEYSSIEFCDLQNLDQYAVRGLETIFSIFFCCENLKEVKMMQQFGKCNKMAGAFQQCKKLKRVKMPNDFGTAKKIDSSLMFSDCAELVDINLDNIDFQKMYRTDCMFENAMKLDLGKVIQKIKLTNCEQARMMFKGANFGDTPVDFRGIDTHLVRRMDGFLFCAHMHPDSIVQFPTTSCEDIQNALSGLNVQKLDLRFINTKHLKQPVAITFGGDKLEEIIMSSDLELLWGSVLQSNVRKELAFNCRGIKNIEVINQKLDSPLN